MAYAERLELWRGNAVVGGGCGSGRSIDGRAVQDRLPTRRSVPFGTFRCRVLRWADLTWSAATLCTSRACCLKRSSRSASALSRASVSSSFAMGHISSPSCSSYSVACENRVEGLTWRRLFLHRRSVESTRGAPDVQMGDADDRLAIGRSPGGPDGQRWSMHPARTLREMGRTC